MTIERERHAEVNRLLKLALSQVGITEASTVTWYVLERCMDAVLGMPDVDTDEDTVRVFHEICSFATRHQRAQEAGR